MFLLEKPFLSFLFFFVLLPARLSSISYPRAHTLFFFSHIRLPKESVSIESYLLIDSSIIGHCYSLKCISSVFYPPPLKPFIVAVICLFARLGRVNREVLQNPNTFYERHQHPFLVLYTDLPQLFLPFFFFLPIPVLISSFF